MSRDLIDVMARLSAEFHAHGLERPDALILKSHDDGMRFLCVLDHLELLLMQPSSTALGRPIVAPDGSAQMEIEVCGIKVRWPAVQFALPEGGFVWM